MENLISIDLFQPLVRYNSGSIVHFSLRELNKQLYQKESMKTLKRGF